MSEASVQAVRPWPERSRYKGAELVGPVSPYAPGEIPDDWKFSRARIVGGPGAKSYFRRMDEEAGLKPGVPSPTPPIGPIPLPAARPEKPALSLTAPAAKASGPAGTPAPGAPAAATKPPRAVGSLVFRPDPPGVEPSPIAAIRPGSPAPNLSPAGKPAGEAPASTVNPFTVEQPAEQAPEPPAPPAPDSAPAPAPAPAGRRRPAAMKAAPDNTPAVAEPDIAELISRPNEPGEREAAAAWLEGMEKPRLDATARRLGIPPEERRPVTRERVMGLVDRMADWRREGGELGGPAGQAFDPVEAWGDMEMGGGPSWLRDVDVAKVAHGGEVPRSVPAHAAQLTRERAERMRGVMQDRGSEARLAVEDLLASRNPKASNHLGRLSDILRRHAAGEAVPQADIAFYRAVRDSAKANGAGDIFAKFRAEHGGFPRVHADPIARLKGLRSEKKGLQVPPLTFARELREFRQARRAARRAGEAPSGGRNTGE